MLLSKEILGKGEFILKTNDDLKHGGRCGDRKKGLGVENHKEVRKQSRRLESHKARHG